MGRSSKGFLRDDPRAMNKTVAMIWVVGFAALAADGAVDFVREVRPILEQHCYECHGSEKQKNGYRLDVRDIALKGGDSGEAAIRPHDAKQSPLIRLVSGEAPYPTGLVHPLKGGKVFHRSSLLESPVFQTG